jgi:hypothetical protein
MMMAISGILTFEKGGSARQAMMPVSDTPRFLCWLRFGLCRRLASYSSHDLNVYPSAAFGAAPTCAEMGLSMRREAHGNASLRKLAGGREARKAHQ